MLGVDQSQEANRRVIHRGGLQREVQAASGIKQGCILSPLLILQVLDSGPYGQSQQRATSKTPGNSFRGRHREGACPAFATSMRQAVAAR